MRTARWIYGVAGVYGMAVLPPLLFTERSFGLDHPPAVTHPELYYGFVFVAIAWQAAFLLIAADPVRLRPLMPVTWLEKFPYAFASVALFARGRLDATMLTAGLVDGVLGVLFVVAYRTTRADAAGHRPPATTVAAAVGPL